MKTERGIDKTATIVVMMSPEGMRAQDSDVISIKAERFYNRLDQRLSNSARVSPETSRLVRSFIEFLGRD